MTPPSVDRPNPKCLLHLRHDSGRSPQSPSCAFHQKWQAAHFSGSSSSSRFSSSQVRLAAVSASMRRAFLPRERSCSLRAIEHCRCVLVGLGHGATFRREKLALFLLPRCEFPVVCYSEAVSRALSRHNKSLFTQTTTLALVAVDTATGSHLCQRNLAAILRDRSRFFDHRNFDSKFSPLGTF